MLVPLLPAVRRAARLALAAICTAPGGRPRLRLGRLRLLARLTLALAFAVALSGCSPGNLPAAGELDLGSADLAAIREESVLIPRDLAAAPEGSFAFGFSGGSEVRVAPPPDQPTLGRGELVPMPPGPGALIPTVPGPPRPPRSMPTVDRFAESVTRLSSAEKAGCLMKLEREYGKYNALTDGAWAAVMADPKAAKLYRKYKLDPTGGASREAQSRGWRALLKRVERIQNLARVCPKCCPRVATRLAA